MDFLNDDTLFENKKGEVKKQLKRQYKRLLKSKEECVEHLNNCLEWEKVQHEGNLLHTYFFRLKKGLQNIELPDWKLNESLVKLQLDPKLEPKEEVALRFKKAKKLKRGILHQEKRLIEIENRMTTLMSLIDQIDKVETLKELLSLVPEKEVKTKEPTKKLPFREYISPSGFTILVGKKSTSNDALTFQYAKGSDLWLHVKDYPGSHVIIVKPKGMEVDQETLTQAANLAKYYSKAKDEAYAEVVFTEKKYVSRLGKKGSGKVQISKQKTLFVK